MLSNGLALLGIFLTTWKDAVFLLCMCVGGGGGDDCVLKLWDYERLHFEKTVFEVINFSSHQFLTSYLSYIFCHEIGPYTIILVHTLYILT